MMMNEIKGRTVRSDGSVVNDSGTLCEILYSGRNLEDCFVHNEDESLLFHQANKLCDTVLSEPKYSNTLVYDNLNWRAYWSTPEPYASLDVKTWCLDKCSTAQERDRVLLEIDEFERRDMLSAIKHMIYCADIWRKNNIVWGVGRGSSVSSFVLYLIGINRLNPLKYNLDLNEWLK